MGISSSRASVKNLVDERFELFSLVFRLAERWECSSTDTEYQRELSANFDAHKQHPAVAFAKENPYIEYDAVFSMAVHIEKVGDKFVWLAI